MKKTLTLIRRTSCVVAVLLMSWVASVAQAADGIPERPYPPRLVNDMAGVFSESAAAQLEDSLVAYSKQTYNQVVIVTTNDLGGYTPNEFATEIGDRWGVGQKKIDNGIVILIKPKTRFSKGQVFIATGRGLEGALPDVFCNRIVEDKMIPILKEGNNYTAATWAALKVITALNGVQDKLTVLVGDLSDKASGTYDIITANIVANAILSLAPAVPGLMAEGATFIASGIIDSRKDEVITGLEKAGLSVVEVKEKRGWECIVCKKA